MQENVGLNDNQVCPLPPHRSSSFSPGTVRASKAFCLQIQDLSADLHNSSFSKAHSIAHATASWPGNNFASTIGSLDGSFLLNEFLHILDLGSTDKPKEMNMSQWVSECLVFFDMPLRQ